MRVGNDWDTGPDAILCAWAPQTEATEAAIDRESAAAIGDLVFQGNQDGL